MGGSFKNEYLKTTVLYDYQIFSLQKFGGISRYFYSIFKTLKKITK